MNKWNYAELALFAAFAVAALIAEIIDRRTIRRRMHETDVSEAIDSIISYYAERRRQFTDRCAITAALRQRSIRLGGK